ncbi:hypothetical protein Tco_1392589 [Tanacetum coccineum]
MSDSEESGITHTEVSSPFEDLSDIGSPRADDHELLEPPYMLEDPYAEAALQAPPSPDYVPGPEHDDDEIVAEDQPYAEDASPIAQSPDYIPESDPEADPEEDGDEDPEEDPIDYPADGGDDGDDEMDIEEDEDDDMDIEADEEDEDDEMDVEIDEEEHLAPAYPVVVALPATAPSAEETETVEVNLEEGCPDYLLYLPPPAARTISLVNLPPSDGISIALGPRADQRGPQREYFRIMGLRIHGRRMVETLPELHLVPIRGTETLLAGLVKCLGTGEDASELAHGGLFRYHHSSMHLFRDFHRANSQRTLRRQIALSDLLETTARRREGYERCKLTALQGQVMTLQCRLLHYMDSRDPPGVLSQPELPEGAGSQFLD